MKKNLLLLYCGLLIMGFLHAQPCSLPGMTPSSAIPVCGDSVFHQAQVAVCEGPDVAHTGCPEAVTSNKSFWYKFTCYTSGTLGFEINGLVCQDDYDWILCDITGRNPNDVFTDASLQVSLNIYGTSGCNQSGIPNNSPTGCFPGASGDVHCQGDASGNSPKNRMPNIIAGHNYLLMVTNWTSGSTAGYNLSFKGGTASITDPKLPHLASAFAYCDAQQIKITLNKKMKCGSLASNGSDFRVNLPGVNVVSASAVQCNNGFDMDTLLIGLSAPLPPGTHKVYAKFGSDGNTLLDYCDRLVPVDDSLSFTVYPLIPTPMDSITPVKCRPDTLELVFKKLMKCSSIGSDGNEFVITGPAPLTVVAANGICDRDGLTQKILLTLAHPITVAGIYTITLQTGTDGNTIINECGQETPAGSTINIRGYDSVSAVFTYNISFGCKQNTVQYLHPGGNNINYWNWNFSNISQSDIPSPIVNYTDYRDKYTTLIVSNGICTDTSRQKIVFDNFMNAAFSAEAFVCPQDSVDFINKTEGDVIEWRWVFGNGSTSGLEHPLPQLYPINAINDYVARPMLITKNKYGCYDTAVSKIDIIHSCYVAVPSAFTPNGDGLNDYLYPLGAYKARAIRFSVYNRFGQRVFYSESMSKKWDGRFRGQEADAGTYVWQLEYINTVTNKPAYLKGYSVLIR